MRHDSSFSFQIHVALLLTVQLPLVVDLDFVDDLLLVLLHLFDHLLELADLLPSAVLTLQKVKGKRLLEVDGAADFAPPESNDVLYDPPPSPKPLHNTADRAGPSDLSQDLGLVLQLGVVQPRQLRHRLAAALL